MPPVSKVQAVASKYDQDDQLAIIAAYEGEKVLLPVSDGSVFVGLKEYHVSFNLPDDTILCATLVKSRDPAYQDSLYITDVKRYGKTDLSSILYKSRYEILDLLCTSFPEEYGFKIFGGRCIAPYIYIATKVKGAACLSCQDPRVIGFQAITLSSHDELRTILKESDVDDDSPDAVDKFPPVENEGKRVAAYKPLIRSMIRKMTGKWRDVYLSKHQASLLPFDADDLMQFGMMQVMIALRKYKHDNEWKAKEATFVYQHLWHRFGQIAHKYSKQSKGYGVHHVRDFIDDDGSLVSAYDLGGAVDDSYD